VGLAAILLELWHPKVAFTAKKYVFCSFSRYLAIYSRPLDRFSKTRCENNHLDHLHLHTNFCFDIYNGIRVTFLPKVRKYAFCTFLKIKIFNNFWKRLGIITKFGTWNEYLTTIHPWRFDVIRSKIAEMRAKTINRKFEKSP